MSSGDTSILQQGGEADDYGNVVLVSGSIVHTGNATCNDVDINLHYEGRDTEHTNSEFTDDLTLDVSCSVEPIESHPNFAKIGGFLGAEENGARFDPRDGRFIGFNVEYPIDSGKLNPYAGVRSYNCPVMVVSQTRIQEEWPDDNEFALLGKIIESATLSNSIPSLSGERNWLFTGIRVRSIGNVYYEVTRSAALSGPRKWLDLIYDPNDSQAD